MLSVARSQLLLVDLGEVLIRVVENFLLAAVAADPDGLSFYIDFDRGTHRAEHLPADRTEVLFLGGCGIFRRQLRQFRLHLLHV